MSSRKVERALDPIVTTVDLYQEVPASIEELEEDPDNIRLENNPETVDGLSRALEQFGRYDVAPRVWRTEDGKLRALAGSGRVRAAKRARQRNLNLEQIPVIEMPAPKSRADKIYLQFAENALRDALGPIDYGRGFKMLSSEGLTYDQILDQLRARGILPRDRTKAWVSQMIQLTELQPAVQRMVNRGEVSIWQGLQLRHLPPDEQLATAERIQRDSLSRSSLRSLVTNGADSGSPTSTEALLQETRDLIQRKAGELRAPAAPQARQAPDPERRHGQVTSHWTLPTSSPRSTPPQSKLAALQRLGWYQDSATAEERELALEAVNGGHSAAAAADLVRRAVQEAPAASAPMRDLLVALRQVHDRATELEKERTSAPAEFARLRLKALLQILGG